MATSRRAGSASIFRPLAAAAAPAHPDAWAPLASSESDEDDSSGGSYQADSGVFDERVSTGSSDDNLGAAHRHQRPSSDRPNVRIETISAGVNAHSTFRAAGPPRENSAESQHRLYGASDLIEATFSMIMVVAFTWRVIVTDGLRKRLPNCDSYGNLFATADKQSAYNDSDGDSEDAPTYYSARASFRGGASRRNRRIDSNSNSSSGYDCAVSVQDSAESLYFSLESLIPVAESGAPASRSSNVSDFSASSGDSFSERSNAYDDTRLYACFLESSNIENFGCTDYYDDIPEVNDRTLTKMPSPKRCNETCESEPQQRQLSTDRSEEKQPQITEEKEEEYSAERKVSSSSSQDTSSIDSKDETEHSVITRHTQPAGGIGHLLETDAPLISTIAGGTSPAERPSSGPPPPPVATIELQPTDSQQKKEESPPIVVQTIGVLRDAQREQWRQHYEEAPKVDNGEDGNAVIVEEPESATAEGSPTATTTESFTPPSDRRRHFMEEFQAGGGNPEEVNVGGAHAAYLYFGENVRDDDADDYYGAEEIGFGRRGVDYGADNIPIPPMGFLDAIIEEDSDELRSAQSSRASSLQQQQYPPGFQQQRQASSGADSARSEVERRLAGAAGNGRANSSGSGSSARGGDVDEDSTSEESTAQRVYPAVNTVGGAQIPRLDLTGAQLSRDSTVIDVDEPEPETGENLEDRSPRQEQEQVILSKAQEFGSSHLLVQPDELRAASSASSASDTDTILLRSTHVEELTPAPAPRRPTQIAAEEVFARATHQPYVQEQKQSPMFDTDRDQSEMYGTVSDQFTCPTPLEDGQVSSTSMSLNMDRSGDDLDESQCSHPHGDPTGVAGTVGGTAAGTIPTPSILPILQKDHGELGNGLTSNQSRSSRYVEAQQVHEEEEEEALPPPPSPPAPPPTDYVIGASRPYRIDDDTAAAVAGELAESVVQAAIRELREKSARERIPSASTVEEAHPARLETPAGTAGVRPLSGRTERVASYFYGDSASAPMVSLTPTKVTEVPIIVRDYRKPAAFSPSEEANKENWRHAKSYVSSLAPNSANVTFASNGRDPKDSRDPRNPPEPHHYDSVPSRPLSRSAAVERIVPIQRYSPLRVDSDTVPVGAPIGASSYDVSPQQTYQMYEMRRRRHHTVSTTRHPPYEYQMTDYSQPANNFFHQRDGRSGFYRAEDASRDDLMAAQDPLEIGSLGHNIDNQFQRSSRSTVRDIPIQRSTSAFAPSSAGPIYEPPYQHSREMSGFSCGGPIVTASALPGNSSTTVYTASKAPGGGPQEEYYRREVLTRTLVTRSTEALSAQPPPPPLGRSSPITVGDPFRQLPEPPRDEVSEEYWYKYSRNVEEEERRIRENQEKRQRDEEERRQREEEMRRRWEQQELEHLERLRNEREKMEKDLENQIKERERIERERIERDRIERENLELQRRQEWERLERERRRAEEVELQKRRELERLEKERLERERIERERLEMEIERIERIKRERREKEEKERQRQREEAERLERERLEAERLERERVELERRERELIEIQRREAEQRERERREDELREQRRRQQEQRERELLEQAEREAAEREMQRKCRERMEQERLDNLRREQERLEFERAEAERRERQRQEEERREKELVDAQLRAKERREQERLEEIRREAQRQEEERREQERRQRERAEAQERERQRAAEEQKERERLAALEAAAAERHAQRVEEERLLRSREELERRAEELRDAERREAEKRERERLEEERRLAELRELERRNAEQRDAERREAAEREANRRKEDRRSRDRLDQIIKEREEHERWELERKRVLAEREAAERRRQALTSKETLERLTRKPYFSRENLSSSLAGALPSQPEVTTKVERQIIERVDRTLWTSDELRGGGGGTRPLAPGGSASALDQRLSPTSDYGIGADYGMGGAAARERIYNPRDDDFRRGGSTRTSKYKARMERARKEFLSHGATPTPATGVDDPVSDRFRKSMEDVRRRAPDYRGPLLQRFHDGELPSRPADYSIGGALPYGRMGASPYDQAPLDDPYRSKSVLDYESAHFRQSRRDVDGGPGGGAGNGGAGVEDPSQHSRSKSADFMLDRRSREEVSVPENELQKSEYIRAADAASPDATVTRHQRESSEHEMRFRKSVERLPVPNWYRDHSTGAGEPYARPPTATTSGIFSSSSQRPIGSSYQVSPNTSPNAGVQKYTVTSSTTPVLSQVRHYSGANQPWSYTERPYTESFSASGAKSPPVGGIAFPPGMFDKYKDEIEDMRRSRTSLHQLGTQEHAKEQIIDQRTITRDYKRESYSTADIRYSEADPQHGYTVSTIPHEWNMPPNRNSRVIEVADTFVGRPEIISSMSRVSRFGGRVTVEEVFDSIFQETEPNLDPIDPSGSQSEQPAVYDPEGPCIFTPDRAKMSRVIEQPQLVESIIDKSTLLVRCTRCSRTQALREARLSYVSCKHCYKYYCSRACRLADWERHRDRCSFARINTLCKEVIMKVRRDHETQYQMSKVAREGFAREGRGSVNIRLLSAHSAQRYLLEGWRVFASQDPNQLLFYYSIPKLEQERKEPSLIALCRRYNPTEKFILSVSIIADIEQCPETPPPEPCADAASGEAYPPRPPRASSRLSDSTTTASTVARQPPPATRQRYASDRVAAGAAYGGAVVPSNV